MAQMNKPRAAAPKQHTHEGAVAMREDPLKALERVIFAHLLWEDSFYVDGQTSASALTEAVAKAAAFDPEATSALILKARGPMNIRHASLLAAVAFAKIAPAALGRATITGTIQRADEMAETIAMVGGKHGLTHTIRRGVAEAFAKFDEFQLSKYKGASRQFSLRDTVLMTHPQRTELVRKILDGTLETPATWETMLSAGGDKKAVFEGLLRDNKLGSMALLRNLRLMDQSGVDVGLIETAFDKANWARVLPFRFLTAALTAPRFSRLLDAGFKKAVAGSPALPGRTAVLLDTSGSMAAPLSQKSIVRAYQAGAALAAAVNGDADLYEWADYCRAVPNWQSLSTALSIRTGGVGIGTQIGQAIQHANERGKYDRLIVITDMQFADRQVPGLLPHQKGYTINVSPYAKAGLLHGRWTHLTGWSDAVLRYIAAEEAEPRE